MREDTKIRVLLVDDHTLFRQGLRTMLEGYSDIQVVGEAGDGVEAIEQVERQEPDVVLMDIHMPGMDGIQATQAIVARHPAVKVLMLTMYPEGQYAFEAVKAGARGYLHKSIDLHELVRRIRGAYRGEAQISADVALRVLEDFRQVQRTRSGRGAVDLTDREKYILRLIGEGATNKEIAARLCLAEKTVETRLSVIFQKLQINNRVQAALYALRTGLATLEGGHAESEGEQAPFQGLLPGPQRRDRGPAARRGQGRFD